jgi:hypothetical protein
VGLDGNAFSFKSRSRERGDAATEKKISKAKRTRPELEKVKLASHRRPSIWARDSGTAPLGRKSASNGLVGSISIFSNLSRACAVVGAYSFNSHYSPCLLRCDLLKELLKSFPVHPQGRICSLEPWNQSRRSTAPMNWGKPQGCCSQRHYHETMDEHEGRWILRENGRGEKVPREHKFSDSNIPRQTQIISRLCSLRIFIDNSINSYIIW